MISRYFTGKPKEYKPVKGDEQAHKVYHMERFFCGPAIDAHVAEAKLQEIAAHACRRWRVPVVQVNVVNVKKAQWGWCDYEIYLNKRKNGDNLIILLHELAHWIKSEKVGDWNGEDHGPVWAGIYIDLLDYYMCIPRQYAEMMFTDHGVEYDDTIYLSGE